MAWLLILASLCLFFFALLFAASLGQSVDEANKNKAGIALTFTAICQLAAMALLFAAGMIFGGA